MCLHHHQTSPSRSRATDSQHVLSTVPENRDLTCPQHICGQILQPPLTCAEIMELYIVVNIMT